MRVATAAPDGLHTHEDAEVLIDFGDAGVLSGRRDSPQSRPPSAAAPSRWSCVDLGGPVAGPLWCCVVLGGPLWALAQRLPGGPLIGSLRSRPV